MIEAPKRREVAAAYVRGLCWVLQYYYQGVASWTWYYPYHYAPCASDLHSLARLQHEKTWEEFELGGPFLPLEQLMAVLPPASAHALPAPLAKLMSSPSSPLAHFYPSEFKQDLNGSTAAWKAVVLLPFIDAEELHSAVAPLLSELPPEAHARNRFGPTYVYVGPHDPLAPELWQLAEHHKGRDGHAMARIAQPPKAERSLLASLTPYPCVPPGGTRGAPDPAMPPIANNRVASAIIRLPQTPRHLPELRPGAQPPQPALGPHDIIVLSREEKRFALGLGFA